MLDKDMKNKNMLEDNFEIGYERRVIVVNFKIESALTYNSWMTQRVPPAQKIAGMTRRLISTSDFCKIYIHT